MSAHCFTDWASWLEERVGNDEAWRIRAAMSDTSMDAPIYNATCMLVDGHPGDHEWTNDHEWGMTFVAAPDEHGSGE